MSIRIRRRAASVHLLAIWFAAGLVHAGTTEIPVAPGVTFVIAVSNSASSGRSNTGEHIAQGDYETVVTITAVNADGVSQTAFIDGVDESGVRRQSSIQRQVLAPDLANSHLQILGFHSADPPVLPGTTSLGPSLAVTRELLTTGKTAYSFRNFASRDTISGTLSREDGENVKFPVLVNGRRVELSAIRATGLMASGSATRPFEHYILDHPQYPVSLRIAYGPRDGAFPFKADFAREIVRIDFPAQQASALSEALAKNCRVEVPGIYFDFNEATLKSQSAHALQEIANALAKQPQLQLHISIEGHTDNIGDDPYNDDLSARRAAAVKTALERDFHVDVANIATKGYGARRPVESNDTLAGRARNRRVELVRECGGGK
jgi:outer membrane protein OmpA-like peptidoglycan-associated protein